MEHFSSIIFHKSGPVDKQHTNQSINVNSVTFTIEGSIKIFRFPTRMLSCNVFVLDQVRFSVKIIFALTLFCYTCLVIAQLDY